MSATTLEITRGIGWKQTFILASDDAGTIPIDLTGSTVTCGIRRFENSDESLAVTVSIEDEAGGEVLLSLTDEQTATLTAPLYFYDVILEDSLGVQSKVLFGQVETSWSPTI